MAGDKKKLRKSKSRLPKFIAITFVVILIVGLGAWYQCSKWSASSGSSYTKISTRIKWFAYASYIGTYVAKDWGIFEARELDVDIHQGGPQIDATKLVSAGSDDFGICGGDQLLVAQSKGLPIVAIAALMQETPAGFMVHEDSDILTMQDFPGHKIRIIPGHNTEIEYRAVMNKLGLDTSELMEIINFSELQLFIAGEVDIEPIYLNNQPATARSKGIKFRILTPTEYGVRSYGNVYFTTKEMIRDRPELVQSFLNSILDAWHGAYNDPNRAVDSLLKFSPMLTKEVELEKLQATKPLMYRADGKIGWMEKKRWLQLEQVLRETKMITGNFSVDESFTNRFVKAYYEQVKETNVK